VYFARHFRRPADRSSPHQYQSVFLDELSFDAINAELEIAQRGRPCF